MDKKIKEIVPTKKYGNIIVYEGAERKYWNSRGYDDYYDIEFEDTGYKRKAKLQDVYNGNIFDRLKKSVCGVACIGYASSSDDPIAYSMWQSIIHKCNNPKHRAYNKFGALGYYVCDRWLRFDYFLEDFNKYIKPADNYKLIIKDGEKEFNFDNCLLVPKMKQIPPDEVFESKNYGSFNVIGREPNPNSTSPLVKIKFIKTGYECSVPYYDFLRGEVKDPYYPSIYGVGYIGKASYKGNEKAYGVWKDMLARVYDKFNKSYNNYGGIGITVDPRWHSFENFLQDIKFINGYNEWLNNSNYHLDKDYLQQDIPKSNRIYSKDTCVFLPSNYNNDIMLKERVLASNRNYYGATPINNGNFYARVTCNNFTYNIGTFTNEIAAANARDAYAKWFCGMERLNTIDFNLPYMPADEWTKYKIGNKQMYHLINKEGN